MCERICSYASPSPPENFFTSSTSPPERSTNPGDNHSQEAVTLSDVTPPTATSQSHLGSPGRAIFNNHHDPTIEDAINLNHMELLIHLTRDKGTFPDVKLAGTYSADLVFGLKTGLESPYLLHQLLALSARHLAFLHPESSASYLHQAVALQTRTVSLFRAAWSEIDQPNCVAVLLFSSILGHHLLAHMLAMPDLGGLEAFMTHYMQCLELHRGIHTVACTV